MSLYLLCGLAFSGKSTMAAALARHLGAVVVSLDEINAARGLHGGVGISPEEWGRTHRQALLEVEQALRSGLSVIVDDTNCFRFLRDNYRAVADRFGAGTTVIYLDVPVSLALARLRSNEDRVRPRVTEPVFFDLVEKFEPPAADECVLVVPPDTAPEAWIERQGLRKGKFGPTPQKVSVREPRCLRFPSARPPGLAADRSCRCARIRWSSRFPP